MSIQEAKANPREIAELLQENDFTGIETHWSDNNNSQVTFRVPGLCGVNIPWLSQAMDKRGWHVEKVDNMGETLITVKEGTDPYIPE